MPVVSEISLLRNVKLLSIPDDVIEKLLKASPAYTAYEIPAGTYNKIDYPVITVGVPSTIIVDEALPEETVYKIIEELYKPETLKYMKNVYFAWNPIPNADFFKRIGIPYHKGAEKYYREQGLID